MHPSSKTPYQYRLSPVNATTPPDSQVHTGPAKHLPSAMFRALAKVEPQSQVTKFTCELCHEQFELAYLANISDLRLSNTLCQDCVRTIRKEGLYDTLVVWARRKLALTNPTGEPCQEVKRSALDWWTYNDIVTGYKLSKELQYEFNKAIKKDEIHWRYSNGTKMIQMRSFERWIENTLAKMDADDAQKKDEAAYPSKKEWSAWRGTSFATLHNSKK